MEIDRELVQVNMWDTTGFNEPKFGTVPMYKSYLNLKELLSSPSGFNLIVFTKKADRITMMANCEILSTMTTVNKIPVVLKKQNAC